MRPEELAARAAHFLDEKESAERMQKECASEAAIDELELEQELWRGTGEELWKKRSRTRWKDHPPIPIVSACLAWVGVGRNI